MQNSSNTAFRLMLKLLKENLKHPLPGRDAQFMMTPKTHHMEQRFSFDEDSARKAAVLIMLYLKNDKIKTVLIKRTEYNGVHSSQISFPGGKYEKHDPSLYYTALREAQEEIGINITDIEKIGNISDLYIPPSNFLVTPFLAYTDKQLSFTKDPMEVESILEFELSQLIDDKFVEEKLVYSAGEINIVAPCFNINNSIIWGATAMMISELKIIIKNIPDIASILQS